MSFIYLASPYSHENSQIRYTRFRNVMDTVAFQLELGHTIFSPILHCHQMAEDIDLPTDAAFWWKHNRAMLEAAVEFWILTLDGWKTSKGIRKEAQLAIKLQLPIKYIDYLGATKVPEE